MPASPPSSLIIRENVPLAPLTTLELGGAAHYFCEVTTETELLEALALAHERQWRLALLGGGSNLIVPDAGFDGLVIRVALRGVHATAQGGRVLLRVAAGEPWDAVVERAVSRNWQGIECLSGIPGLVGAAPIQNIGAYGQEVAEAIVSVSAVDRESRQVVTLKTSDLGFAYRTSELKRVKDRYVVVGIELRLLVDGPPALRYTELQRAFGSRSADGPTLRDVRERVLVLRKKKSMVIAADDPNRRTAGSFFLNALLAPTEVERLAERAVALGCIEHPEAMPRFSGEPSDDGEARVKVPAAWLIEQAGFHKGLRSGAVGISDKHALALVHHGGGCTRELLALAKEIRERVQERFGVSLEREPALLDDAG